MSASKENVKMLTFGEHLEELRAVLLRIIAVTITLSIVIFCCKEVVFKFIFAPSEWDFITYSCIEKLLHGIGIDFNFEEYHTQLITTDLASQFMTHIRMSLFLGLLGTSPYILFELFRFISPALYKNERKYSVLIAFMVYILFAIGLLMSYFILFPISYRFLGTYSVAERIHNTITLNSYISTFVSLTLIMGIVFQLPLLALILAKMDIIQSSTLIKYRKYAFFILVIVSAIITPPDILTCILVTMPLYFLYELSIRIIKNIETKRQQM